LLENLVSALTLFVGQQESYLSHKNLLPYQSINQLIIR